MRLYLLFYLWHFISGNTVLELFNFYQVDCNFTGFYQLVLYSNGLGETNVSFQINVVDESPTIQTPISTGYSAASTGSQVVSSLPIGAIVAIAGSLVAIALLALLVTIYMKKRNRGIPVTFLF